VTSPSSLSLQGPDVAFRLLRSIPAEDREALRAFFAHKGAPYVEHLDDFLANAVDGDHEGLEWRFHMMFAGGAPVANVCTWECGGHGILGHVYTVPSFRRRGLADAILRRIADAAPDRGVTTMQLNCTPDSHQEKLYATNGYRTIPGIPGAMLRRFRPDAPRPSAPGEFRVAPFQWRHWPGCNLLFLRGDLGRPHSVGLNLHGPASAEGPLLHAVYTRTPGTPPPVLRALVTSSEHVVGFASLLPDPSDPRGQVADVLTTPGCEDRAGALLDELTPHFRLPVRWQGSASRAADLRLRDRGFKPSPSSPPEGTTVVFIKS
jgi:GNAT superfamily N-acetyltransferase